MAEESLVPTSMKALPKSTVRLIASSQVITSVNSVVKELIENSLDASATNLEIKIENYGFDKIEIRDNGSGIRPSDAPFMAQPHYTSKITSTEDLQRLATYGFRGEALGSLCAVSDVTITTKTDTDDIAMTYTLSQKGQITATKPSHLGTGTTISACNLFKNLPVRKQFLNSVRKRKDEMKKVEDCVMAFGVIRPDVRISFRHNRDVIWQKNKVSDSKCVLQSIIGNNVMSCMKHIKEESQVSKVAVEAFLPKPKSDCQLTSRSCSDRCFMYINMRPVHIKELEKMLKQYYCNAVDCDSGRCPVAFVSLTLPPDRVDVNLEPNKTAVLVHNKEDMVALFKAILENLYGTLDNNNKKTTGCAEPALSGRGSGDLTSSNHMKKDVLISQEDSKECTNKENGGQDSILYTSGIVDHGDSKIDNRKDITEASEDQLIIMADRNNANFLESTQNANRAVQNDKEQPQLSLTQMDFDLFSDDDFSFDILSNQTKHLPLSGKQPERVEEGHRKMGESTGNIDSGWGKLMESCTPVISSRGSGNPAEMNEISIGALTEPALIDSRPTNSVPRSTTQIQVCNKVLDWSAGSALKNKAGETVEPVKLLAPSADYLSAQTPGMRPVPSKSYSSASKKRLSSNLMNQSLIDDHVSQIPPPEWHLKMKPQVLLEYPNGDDKQVTAILCDRWKSLPENEKQLYKTSTTTGSHGSSSKRLQRSPDDSSKTLKRRKLQVNNKSPQNVTQLPVATVKTVNVPFSLNNLRRKFSTGFRQSQSQCNTRVLIGAIKSHSVWLCLQGSKICSFNPYRAQEALIYHKLLRVHRLATNRLEVPTRLTESAIGFGLWKTLFDMQKSEDPCSPFIYFTDEQLVSNGFEIRKHRDVDTEDTCVEVISMCDSIPSYGISDLQEILRNASSSDGKQLDRSRPNKVKHFLQSESVRMTRGLPNHYSRDEIEDIIRQISHKLPPGCSTCFHGRPYYSSLYDLGDLPEDQDKMNEDSVCII